MSDTKLNIPIVDLGRMHARQASISTISHPAPNLIATSSPNKNEFVWVKCNLEGVRIYESYDEMLRVERRMAYKPL